MSSNLQTREKRIAEALEATELAPLRVGWRGKREDMPVVAIEVDSVILNPNSHRIKAQLESDPGAREAVGADSEGVEAQAAIRRLLRMTPGYEALKENLASEGQKDPGIVTRQGLLVNANTRAVALGDLGHRYIEVAVLPKDATLAEIYDLELDLQVAQDYRQEYSFTNELLFIEDLITEQNRDERQVAEQLRWITPTKPATQKKGIERVKRYVRHLDLIREIQEMSGWKVPLTEFDDAEQALQEFDSAYEGMRIKDPEAARQLKNARTLGLLVDLGYERQRIVDGKWVEDYLAEAVGEQELLRDIIPLLSGDEDEKDDDRDSGGADDPFADFEDDRSDGESDDIHSAVQHLVLRLGESARDDVVMLPTAEGDKEFVREAVRGAINEAMRTAAEDAKNAARAGDALKLPAHHVEEAVKRLKKARQTYGAVSDRPEFDVGPLEAEIARAAQSLEALRETLK